MSEYIHHISGRLRVKLAQIRRKPERAREIRTVVRRISGVTCAEANAVTGSLLIHYNPAQVDGQTIMRAMIVAGWLAPSIDMPAIRPMQAAMFGRVLDSLVEKLVERSAIALLGALL